MGLPELLQEPDFPFFKKEIDERVYELFRAGLSDQEIADELGVTKRAIEHRRGRLGLLRIRYPSNPEGWHEARVSKLRELWSEGLSASEIGEKLGVSRCAVLGKAHRLKLPARAGGPKPKDPSQKKPRRPSAKRAKLRLVWPSVVINDTPDDQIPVSQRRTLLELGRDDCRWPVGDPQSPDFFFCGGPQFSGHYCATHYFRSIRGLSCR